MTCDYDYFHHSRRAIVIDSTASKSRGSLASSGASREAESLMQVQFYWAYSIVAVEAVLKIPHLQLFIGQSAAVMVPLCLLFDTIKNTHTFSFALSDVCLPICLLGI